MVRADYNPTNRQYSATFSNTTRTGKHVGITQGFDRNRPDSGQNISSNYGARGVPSSNYEARRRIVQASWWPSLLPAQVEEDRGPSIQDELDSSSDHHRTLQDKLLNVRHPHSQTRMLNNIQPQKDSGVFVELEKDLKLYPSKYVEESMRYFSIGFYGSLDSELSSPSESMQNDIPVNCLQGLVHFNKNVASSTPGARPKVKQVDNLRPLSNSDHDKLDKEDCFRQDWEGDTALMVAIITKNNAFARYSISLISDKADYFLLDLQNRVYRQSALHLAIIMANMHIFCALLDAGASLDVYDRHGNTPVHIMCKNGLTDYLKELVEPTQRQRHLDLIRTLIGTKNYDGETCLHLAAKHSHFDIVEYLITSKLICIDVNLTEGLNGRTVLHLVVQTRDLCLAMLLVRSPDINIDALTLDGHPPLRLAAGLKHTDMVNLLISAGADYNLMYEDEEEEMKREKELGLDTDSEEEDEEE